MIWNGILKIVCISLWTLVGVICAIVTEYELDERYTDKLCSDFLVEFELFASSLLSCLAYTTSSSALIYHRKSKTCYGIKQGYKIDDFATTLKGAKLYVKATATEEPRSCFRGTFVHESCYLLNAGYVSWSQSMDYCKNISTTAHLADIKTEEENDKVKNAFDGQLFWLGAKYDNGWVWSDGTPVDLQYWPKGRHYEFELLCMVLIKNPGAYEAKWEAIICQENAQGICEID